MQTLDQADRNVADLYWLAFLLTGRPQTSIDLAVDAVDSEKDNQPFFSGWMRAWSRKVVIAKALGAVREELAESARRLRAKREARRTAKWSQPLNAAANKAELESALLAIDLFPRCAVLLSFFEGLSLDDATVLLDGDRELVRKAQITGLQELTQNLVGMGAMQYA